MRVTAVRALFVLIVLTSYSPAFAQSTGYATCDKHIAMVRECINGRMPERICAAQQQQIDHFREMLANPLVDPTLSQTCEQNLRLEMQRDVYSCYADRAAAAGVRTACAPGRSVMRRRQALRQVGRAGGAAGRLDSLASFFSFNSDVIREESEPTLDEIGMMLQRRQDWKLAINGHTDSIASDAYNLELSRRRAIAVKAALVTRYGVAPDRLTTAGMGEASPKDTNETLEGRARNRRVELVKQ